MHQCNIEYVQKTKELYQTVKVLIKTWHWRHSGKSALLPTLFKKYISKAWLKKAEKI